MKLLIEVDEKLFENAKFCVEQGLGTFIDENVVNGTPIPNNATNGDVINTLFSDIGIIQTDPYTGIIEIDLDWWNAPYKGENNAE